MGVKPLGPPGDRLRAGAGWGPGCHQNAADKQHAWTIFHKAMGIQKVLPSQ